MKNKKHIKICKKCKKRIGLGYCTDSEYNPFTGKIKIFDFCSPSCREESK